MRAFGFNPQAVSVLYAARADSLCVSTNSGSSWTGKNSWPGSGAVSRILMHPSYPISSNYYWIIQGGAVYRTANGGATWIQVTTAGLPGGTTFSDMKRDLSSNVFIFAATNNGVWKIDPQPKAPTGLAIGSFAVCPCPNPPGCIQYLATMSPNAPPQPCPWSYYALLVWSANAEGDVNTTGGTYSIYRSISHDGGYSQIASAPYTSTDYVDGSVPLPNSTTYYYKMTATDAGGNVSDNSSIVQVGGPGGLAAPRPSEETKLVPGSYQLFANNPNPFNPTTRIQYVLPEAGFVTLKVYDVLGHEVAALVSEFQDAGFHSADFNASNVSSGVYFYHFTAGKFTDVKKMNVMK